MATYRLTLTGQTKPGYDPADMLASMIVSLPEGAPCSAARLGAGMVNVRVAFKADDDEHAIGLARGARQSASLLTQGQPLIERLIVRRGGERVDLAGSAR